MRLRPGIWRHYAPEIEDVDMNGEEGVEHVLVTSGAGPVVGKLIRWVWNDGEVGYALMASKTTAVSAMSQLSAST
jgi:hypothetical protein